MQQINFGNQFLVEGNIIEVVESPILELGNVALQDIRNREREISKNSFSTLNGFIDGGAKIMR